MNDTPNNYHQTKLTVNSKQTINETLNDMEKSWIDEEEKVNSVFFFLPRKSASTRFRKVRRLQIFLEYFHNRTAKVFGN